MRGVARVGWEWKGCLLGVMNHRAKPGAPPPTGGLLVGHPTTGVPWLAFLPTLPSQWVLISIFQAVVAKEPLMSSRKSPAGGQAPPAAHPGGDSEPALGKTPREAPLRAGASAPGSWGLSWPPDHRVGRESS